MRGDGARGRTNDPLRARCRALSARPRLRRTEPAPRLVSHSYDFTAPTSQLRLHVPLHASCLIFSSSRATSASSRSSIPFTSRVHEPQALTSPAIRLHTRAGFTPGFTPGFTLAQLAGRSSSSEAEEPPAVRRVPYRVPDWRVHTQSPLSTARRRPGRRLAHPLLSDHGAANGPQLAVHRRSCDA